MVLPGLRREKRSEVGHACFPEANEGRPPTVEKWPCSTQIDPKEVGGARFLKMANNGT